MSHAFLSCSSVSVAGRTDFCRTTSSRSCTVLSTSAQKSSSFPLNRLYNAPVVTPAFLQISCKDASRKPFCRNSSFALSMMRGSILLSATDIFTSYNNSITDNSIIIIIICCSPVKSFAAILRNFRNKIWAPKNRRVQVLFCMKNGQKTAQNQNLF